MINDITLLQAMRSRSNYANYAKFINRDAITKEGEMLLDDIGEYFKQFPDIQEITELDKFNTWFNHVRHIDLKKDKREQFTNLINRMGGEYNGTVNVLLDHYEKQAAFDKIVDVIKNNGNLDTIESLVNKYKKNTTVEDLYQDMTLEHIDEEPSREHGLKWRLPVLNQSLGSVILGDFGVIAGVPNTGKTAFLISEVSHMAQQLPEGKIVLWFNNEGLDSEIRNRIIQSTLNKTYDEIVQNPSSSMSEYNRHMGMPNRIQVIKATWQHYTTIEKIIKYEKDRVGLIVLDMLDKIKGFEGRGKSETSDEKYDRAYEWALGLSIIFAPVLATSQTCALGEDVYKMRYPGMDDLKGSRIAKQGNARFILMIGRDNVEEQHTGTRFLSSPKNKVGVNFQAEVTIDKLRARYHE
jgi:replicative DNA helicase